MPGAKRSEGVLGAAAVVLEATSSAEALYGAKQAGRDRVAISEDGQISIRGKDEVHLEHSASAGA